MDNPRELEKELEELKRKQARELEEFEKQSRERLHAFEAKERGELHAFKEKENQEVEAFIEEAKAEFLIKIDRHDYRVKQHTLSGNELRALPQPPIGQERDLFEVVPGGSDRKISGGDIVKMRDGLRFFTAPAQINPGRTQ